MKNDKIFADGLLVRRHENAPDFVTCSLSFKVSEFANFMAQNSNDGWLNIQVKQGKNGKYYAELDTWRPTPKQEHDRGMAQVKEAAKPAQSYQSSLPEENFVTGAGFADDDIPFSPMEAFGI